jgi:hypothetical protein
MSVDRVVVKRVSRRPGGSVRTMPPLRLIADRVASVVAVEVSRPETTPPCTGGR